MYDTPIQTSRPVRSNDQVGGSRVAMEETTRILWADPLIQDGEMAIAFHPEEDVRIGDLVAVPHNLFLKEG